MARKKSASKQLSTSTTQENELIDVVRVMKRGGQTYLVGGYRVVPLKVDRCGFVHINRKGTTRLVLVPRKTLMLVSDLTQDQERSVVSFADVLGTSESYGIPRSAS